MEVQIYSQLHSPAQNPGSYSKRPEIKENDPLLEGVAELKKETPPKVMMDLQDVQNFLYMIIGSEIKVKSANGLVGSSFDTAA